MRPAHVPLLEVVMPDPTSATPAPDGDLTRTHLVPPTEATTVRTAGTALDVTDDRPAAPRFRRLRSHARGGLGEVFLAEDVELNRHVALKEIQPQHADSGHSRARFLLEAEVTGALEHPGVVPVYSLGRNPDGRPFYAMRFVRGDTLKQAIDKFHAGPAADFAGREFRALLTRFVSVCNTVAYAHSRGVVHRDVKPANVLLGPFGETLLVDWGLAKLQASGGVRPRREDDPEPVKPSSGSQVETLYGSVVGTPQFMAPEQAAGSPDVGPAADVYALGATLYAVVTGKPPATGSAEEVVRKVRAGEIVPPAEANPRAPKGLAAVVRKAMALDPAGRYPSALDLAADVERWLADEPVVVYRDPFAVRAARWARRNRTLVVLAGAVLTCAVVGLSGGLVAVDRERQNTQAALDQEAEAKRYAQAQEAEARRQEGIAQQQRDRAEAARKRAREAFDASVDLAVGPLTTGSKRLTPAQAAVVRKLVAQYEALAADAGPDPLVKLGALDARLRVGTFFRQLGDFAKAEAAWKQAAADADETARTAGDDRYLAARATAARAQALANLAVLYHGRNYLADAQRHLDLAAAEVGKLPADDPQAAAFARVKAAEYRNLQGLFHHTAGDGAKALAAYQEAVALYRELAGADPNPRLRDQLAASLNNVGQVYEQERNFPEAAKALAESVEVRRKLAAEFPAEPDFREGLAESLNSLGSVTDGQGNPVKAAPLFAEAGKEFARLAAEFPAVPQYVYHQAQALNNLGSIYFMSLLTLKQAETPFKDALGLYQSLARLYPDVPEYRAAAARTQNNLGYVYVDVGPADEATRLFDSSVATARQLVADHPDVTAYRNTLAGGLVGLGEMLNRKGEATRARAAVSEAVREFRTLIDADPRNNEYRVRYGVTAKTLAGLLQAAKDHAALAALAADLGRLTSEPADDRLEAAGWLAGCVKLARDDPKLSPVAKAFRAERYGAASVEQLRGAAAKGFKAPSKLRAARFEPVRDRADFKQLVEELGGQK
jgi:serine/threonine-protein kinase